MSKNNNIITTLLSQLGTRMYFPKGIVAQTEQSAGAKIKATAGVAFDSNGLATLPEAKKFHAESLGGIRTIVCICSCCWACSTPKSVENTYQKKKCFA